ncbi:hypothetical protein NDU88_004393 [Pleurodeles waltl]|uniref:Uncharacterized protein n=1 Tax=Pleurodeles waltl TaxID=8319 RepID=A0AAV7NJB9_PLEWA|nr:hypothetical protein NDU88_004393 [Pleurodeles waltl]
MIASCRVVMPPCAGPPGQVLHTASAPSKGGGAPQVSSGPVAGPSSGTPHGAAPPRFFLVRCGGGHTPPCWLCRMISWGGQGPPELLRTAPARSVGSSAVQLPPHLQARSARPRHQSANTGHRGPLPA